MQKNKNINKTLVVTPSSWRRLAAQGMVPTRECALPVGDVRGTGQSLPLKVEVGWQKIGSRIVPDFKSQ